MRISRGLVLLVMGSLLAGGAAGCNRSAPPTPPPPPPVTITHPVRQVVTDYGDYTGTTQAVETVDVRARVQGWLQSMHYVPDAPVDKDALLFVIDPSQYEATLSAAKATLAQRQAAQEFAQFDYERVGNLYRKGAAADYEYNQAIANLDQAKAAVQAAQAAVEEAQLNLSYTKVTAPIAGRASRNLVDVGNLVGAASQPTVLATIVNDRQVYVYFSVSEAEFLRYVRMFGSPKAGGPATRPASQRRPAYLGLEDEAGYPHEGRVDYADVRIDPATGTLMARAVFDDPNGIIVSGLFARIRIPLDTRQALLVPDVAVAADQGGQYVLLVNDQDVVGRRNVRAGETVGRMRVIEEGLSITDRVIINGIQRAPPGSQVRVMEAPASAPAEKR